MQKVNYDTHRHKCFEALIDLEELLTSEMGSAQMRAEQRALDKIHELNRDTHWRILEALDDVNRDLLTDGIVFNDVFNDITKA